MVFCRIITSVAEYNLKELKACEVIVIVARRLVPLLLVVMGCVAAFSGQSQDVAAEAQVAQLRRAPQEDQAEEEARRKIEHDQQKKVNEERFRKLKEDTDKLVQLSNELKEYVGKANEHTLSLDVIKKAEEIERLAKSVKEKMRAN